MNSRNEPKNVSVPATDDEKALLELKADLWARATGRRHAKLATFLRTIGMEWTPPATVAANAQQMEGAA
jgi:hypothetical protein